MGGSVKLLYCTLGWSVEFFFFIRQNRSTNQRSGMISALQIQNFSRSVPGARVSKFSFLKNSRGLKYQYIFVKIGMKLPFTIKNKPRNTIMKFEFQNYFFTPQKARFWFLKKNTQTNICFVFRLGFIFKNNKHTIVILFGIF